MFNSADGLKDLVAKTEDLVADPSNHSEIEKAVKLFGMVRGFYDDMAALTKRLSKLNTLLKEEIIPARMEEKGITSITVEGYRYTVSTRVRASIRAGLKEEAFEWLRSNEMAELITETVNASTLSASAKVLMEEGRELEPNLFNVAMIPNTSRTKV
jgi:hypothetical protein